MNPEVREPLLADQFAFSDDWLPITEALTTLEKKFRNPTRALRVLESAVADGKIRCAAYAIIRDYDLAPPPPSPPSKTGRTSQQSGADEWSAAQWSETRRIIWCGPAIFGAPRVSRFSSRAIEWRAGYFTDVDPPIPVARVKKGVPATTPASRRLIIYGVHIRREGVTQLLVANVSPAKRSLQVRAAKRRERDPNRIPDKATQDKTLEDLWTAASNGRLTDHIGAIARGTQAALAETIRNRFDDNGMNCSPATSVRIASALIARHDDFSET